MEKEVAWRNVDLGDRPGVIDGLRTVIECPLGPTMGNISLKDIARSDRLDELGFEIPLVGGDVPHASLHVSDIADLLESHLPKDDPVARYATALRDPALGGTLRGYLNGSIDLVFRGADGRYSLADYKTNKLGGGDETLTAWHYRPEALDAEMAAAHYPLQGLLYAVALHRYLRWRLAGYDPAQHFGSVLYLFVRGMSAVEAVDQCGIWTWTPPPALLVALSTLFDRGPAS
jgi:exodeoxyribonuclease V beta subunit